MNIGELVAYLKVDDKQANQVVDKFPEKIRGLGGAAAAGAVAAGAIVAANLAAGFNNAIEAEMSHDRLAAQLDLSGPMAERAGAAAGALYADAYGANLGEVNDAIGAVLSSFSTMSDASQGDIEAVTARVMDLANVMEIDTTRAAQVAGQMVTQGLAGDPIEAVDLLTAAMQRVPAAVREDILDAADEYGPFFANMGISGSEAMSMLVTASEDGMYGIDKLGDAVKEFTIRATDGSAATVSAYEAMGMSSDDMSNRLLAGGDTARQAFDEIIAGLQGIEDPQERANTAIALFGTPLEDLSVNEIPQFLDQMGNMQNTLGDVEGAAQRLGDTANGNFATAWTSVQRAWEGVWTGLASQMLPALTEVANFLVENPAILNAVAIGLTVMAAALTVAAVAQWAMNSALLASPITWIIVAVMALVAAIVALAMNWDTVVAWITEVWGGFLGWLQEVTDAANAWWNSMWSGFGSWVTSVWDGFIAWIVSVWSGFMGFLRDTGNNIANWWNGLWSAVGAWIQSVWQGFTSWVQSVFTNFSNGIRNIGAAISAWWNGLWSAVGSFIQSTWQGFTSFVQGIFANFQAGVRIIGSAISNWWNSLWSGIGSFIRSTWQGFISFVVSLFQGWLATARGIGSSISSWWTSLWTNVSNGVKSAWDGIINFLGGLGSKILAVFSGAGQWLVSIGRNILDGLWSGLQSGWNAVVGWINSLGGGIIDTFASILGIHSPSRVFRGFGRNIDEGLLLGLKDLQPEIDEHVNAMVTVPVTPDSSAMLAGVVGASSSRSESKTIHYYAAENSSLSAEEDLFEALGKTRGKF